MLSSGLTAYLPASRRRTGTAHRQPAGPSRAAGCCVEAGSWGNSERFGKAVPLPHSKPSDTGGYEV
ncbi:hypothetical protein GCM10009601_45350 [Streptomyces thermospinosisporus]|uniref:Uncharacterized protein n=1 Tax=Streptomyces thermospinosisporus TaxID=161482 RepID=A0ABN1Z4C4_9ACTN